MGVVGLVVLHLAALRHPPIKDFANSVLGIALQTLLLSVLVVPYIPGLLEASRRRFLARRLITHLVDRARHREALDTSEAFTAFKKLYGSERRANSLLTRDTLQALSPVEAAGLVLTLQYFHRASSYSDSLNPGDFLQLAATASRDQSYRWIVLKTSLDRFFTASTDTSSLATHLLDRYGRDPVPVGVSHEQSDVRFLDRLKGARDDVVYNFSTTSQESNLSFSSLRQYQDAVAEIHHALVSPLIGDHAALLGLAEEYDVPTFALPHDQFVLGRNSIDLLRRVLRIIVAIDKTLELARTTPISVKLYVFPLRYPSLKLRLIKHRAPPSWGS